MKQLLAFFFLLIPSTLYADCNIAVKHRIPNASPGVCTWSCMESICLHLGYTEIRGLTGWHYHNGTFSADDNFAERQLDAYKIKHKTSFRDEYKFLMLKKAAEAGLPALIGLKPVDLGNGHVVIMKHMTEDRILLYDTNQWSRVYSVELTDFMNYWDGWAVVIYPPK